ncbi:MAG: hypothetical protein GXN99_00360 [Candidatus Nanohaloarchaeota archaeon]|nr:hypothetical protein [Candidatus Nanohaloarchaeota archaeon]
MHKGHDVFVIKDLSKIEGHASLEVKLKDRKVEKVMLKVEENRRFYQKAAVGKNIIALNQSLSRICGTCSAAHQFATLKAIEHAYGLKVSEDEVKLRKLLYYGNMIRDHAMHLYLFSLPDVLGYDSVFEFGKEHKDLVREGFYVQQIGANLAEMVGGRAIHQLNISLRGFNTSLDTEKLATAKQKLDSLKKYVKKLIKYYTKQPFYLDAVSEIYGCLKNDDFGFLEGTIRLNGAALSPDNYLDSIEREWKDYSHSYTYYYEGKPYLLGALARLNLNLEALSTNAKNLAQNYFPSHNIYDNNLAQAIEVMHSIDRSIEIINYFLDKGGVSPLMKDLPRIDKEAQGYAVIEAPRGLLYYSFHIDNEGKVTKAEIITPTAQNHAHMEASIKLLIENNLDLGKEKLKQEIEALIRAYDPCFSCASHFLRIKWS